MASYPLSPTQIAFDSLSPVSTSTFTPTTKPSPNHTISHSWHSNALAHTSLTRQYLLSRIFNCLPPQKPTLSERHILIAGPLCDISCGPRLLFRAQPQAILLHYCPALKPYLEPSTTESKAGTLRLPAHATDRDSTRLVLEHLRAVALHPAEERPALIPPAGVLRAIRLVETAKLFGLPEARKLDVRVVRRMRYTQLSAEDVKGIWDTLPRDGVWVKRMAAWLLAHQRKGDVREWEWINGFIYRRQELGLFLVKCERERKVWGDERWDLSDPALWTEEEKAERMAKEEAAKRFAEARRKREENESAEKRADERRANPHLIRRLSERRKSIMKVVETTHKEQVALKQEVVKRRWRMLIGVVRVVVTLARGINFEWADSEIY